MTDKEALPYRPCVGIMLLNREGRAFVGRRADRASATLRASANGGRCRKAASTKARSQRTPHAASCSRRRACAAPASSRAPRTGSLYDLPQELIGVAWEGRYRGQKQMWFAARFEGPESEINLSPREGHEPEFDAWQWVRVEELPSLIVPFKRAVYERVVEEFAPLLKG